MNLPTYFRCRSRNLFQCWAVAAASLALAAMPANRAYAHAILVESTPAAGDTVAPGHLDIQLRYNSRIDKARSRLTVTRPDGKPTVLKVAAGGPPDVMTTSVEAVPGSYTLRWQVLAVDGHITRGDVPFVVKPGTTKPGG